MSFLRVGAFRGTCPLGASCFVTRVLTPVIDGAGVVVSRRVKIIGVDLRSLAIEAIAPDTTASTGGGGECRCSCTDEQRGTGACGGCHFPDVHSWSLLFFARENKSQRYGRTTHADMGLGARQASWRDVQGRFIQVAPTIHQAGSDLIWRGSCRTFGSHRTWSMALSPFGAALRSHCLSYGP